jgi:GTP:adenosylcobinamide-phosphate guanylyltransferase
MAGGVPQQDDLLFEFTQGRPKAMIPLVGKPMVQWVLDALTGVERIDRILMVGLGPDEGLRSPKLARFIPDQGSMLRNVIRGVDAMMELNPVCHQVVISSADIPLITAEIVERHLDSCAGTDLDMQYGVVERSVMEGRFPNSRRSYIRLTDGEYAGADLFVINPEIVYSNRQMWEELMGSRKSIINQARIIGLGTLLRLLFRRLSLRDAEIRVMRALELTGRAVPVVDAELGMDVDKPFQLEICRQVLETRS